MDIQSGFDCELQLKYKVNLLNLKVYLFVINTDNTFVVSNVIFYILPYSVFTSSSL